MSAWGGRGYIENLHKIRREIIALWLADLFTYLSSINISDIYMYVYM